MYLANESLFFLHVLSISICCAFAARLSQEALIALVAIQALLSNLFVVKQISLFGFFVTPTDVFTVGASLCLNLLQDRGGQERAQRAVYSSLFCLVVYTLMTKFQLWYMPAPMDIAHEHFMPLLTAMPRIIAASIFCYFVSQMLDTQLYRYINKRYTGSNFVIKNYTSIALSQLVDTLLFSYLGLYGLVHNINHIIIISYSIKLITTIILVPLTRIIGQLITIQRAK